jgi:hypothetical protein
MFKIMGYAISPLPRPSNSTENVFAKRLCPDLIMQPHPVSDVKPWGSVNWFLRRTPSVNEDVASGVFDRGIGMKFDRYVIQILDPKSERNAFGHAVSFDILASKWLEELCRLLAICRCKHAGSYMVILHSKHRNPGKGQRNKTYWLRHSRVAGAHTPCPNTILEPRVHHSWVLGPRNIGLYVCTFPCPPSWLVLVLVSWMCCWLW